MTQQQQFNHYLILFKTQDEAVFAAGFNVCLAINALALPLTILVEESLITFWKTQQLPFEQQLRSLLEFEEVNFKIMAESITPPSQAAFLKF